MSDQEDYTRTAGREQEREPLKPLKALPILKTLLFVFILITVATLIYFGAVYLVEWLLPH